ncbi:MAG: hypothetical protein GXP41_04595 [Chloroflexi bacterium]|nr:hypothetical protein [Chloroflexota bacterium]
MTGNKWAVASFSMVGISLLAYYFLIGRIPVEDFPALTGLASLVSIAGFGAALMALRHEPAGEGMRLAWLSLTMATAYLIVLGILSLNIAIQWIIR